MNLIQSLWAEIQAAELQAVGPALIQFNNAVVKSPNITTLVSEGTVFLAQAAAAQPTIAQALASDLAATVNAAVTAEIAKAVAATTPAGAVPTTVAIKSP